MIDIATFLAETKTRQDTFDGMIASCIVRQDYFGAMSMYADYITSCYGEKIDRKDLAIKLDDIIEVLKKNNCTFQGQPISERRKDKDDPNVIRYVVTVPNKHKIKNDDGTTTTSINGTKQSTKTRHVHAETMQIYKMAQTNIFGIPAIRLFGSYFRGKAKPYVTANGYRATNANTFLEFRSLKRSDKEMFINVLGKEIANYFFEDISTRESCALASIAAISINRTSDYSLTTGLVRTDYELVNDVPVCSRVIIAFLPQPLIKAGLTDQTIIKATTNFITKLVQDNGLVMMPNAEQRVFVPGGIKGFLQTLAEADSKNASMLARHAVQEEKKQAAIRSAIEYERQQAEREEQERQAEYKRKQEERARLRALKAEKAEQDRLARKESGASSKKHDKQVKDTITSIVTDLLSHGITPSKEIYTNILNDVKNDKQNKTSAIVCEALEALINTDTSAADAEIAELASQTVDADEE